MAVDGNGDTYWTPADGAIQASLEIDLGRPATFDRAMLQEMIATGQRVERVQAGSMGRPGLEGVRQGHDDRLQAAAEVSGGDGVEGAADDSRRPRLPDDPRVRPVQGVGKGDPVGYVSV